jgi:NAD(P)-dependent dehydrogenase (short-subunit alcohol dehydrogenase family)
MAHQRALLITGGGRGIGAATALRAAQHGWSLVLNYRERASAAEAVVDEIRGRGGRAIAVPGDVAQESDVLTMFDVAEREYGALAGVVNNAGVVAEAMPLAEMSAARIERMFAVNIYGAFLVAREGARRMSRTRGGQGGSIVNVSSAASRLGSPGEYVDYQDRREVIERTFRHPATRARRALRAASCGWRRTRDRRGGGGAACRCGDRRRSGPRVAPGCARRAGSPPRRRG